MLIRRATPADGAAIAAVLAVIAAERKHSAIDRAWTSEQQERYLAGLWDREAFHVAVDAECGLVGYQALDLWSPLLRSMSHVA